MKNSSHNFKDSTIGYYTGALATLVRQNPLSSALLVGFGVASIVFQGAIMGSTLLDGAATVGFVGTLMTRWPDRLARRILGKPAPEKDVANASEMARTKWVGMGSIGYLLTGLAVAGLGATDVAAMIDKPFYQSSMGAFVGGYGSAAGILVNAFFATVLGWAAVNHVSKAMYIRRAKKIVQGAVAEHPELQNAIKIQRVGALGESEVAVQLEMDGATLHPAMEALGFKLPPEVPTDLAKEDVAKMTWVVSFDEKEADTIK